MAFKMRGFSTFTKSTDPPKSGPSDADKAKMRKLMDALKAALKKGDNVRAQQIKNQMDKLRGV